MLKLIALAKYVQKTIYSSFRNYCNDNYSIRKPPWKILFFGADNFSLFSLKALSNEYRTGKLISHLEVVTTISGKPNPVKVFAENHDLHIHKWPVKLTKNAFDVGLVVSFGHLIPEHIIDSFRFGMLNIHASLLPRWRGAAPIIYAIASGDTETGITVMRIKPKKFDVGEIVCQAQVNITDDMKMPELYFQLGNLGATYLIKSLKEMPLNLEKAQPQPKNGATLAPKVTSKFSEISWNTMSARQIYNLERALTDVFPLTTQWKGISVKLIGIKVCVNEEIVNNKHKPGYVTYDSRTKLLKVLCGDRSLISVEKVGVYGKKVGSASDFNNGYIKKEIIDNRYFK